MTNLNSVDIEKGSVDVAEFKQTDAALAVLREKYSVIPDANTEDGYAFVKDGCKELTGLRTAIEKKRKEIKEPYIQAGQIIDAEAKRITAAIVELEEPLKEVKKEVDEREKRMKEERLARLGQKVQAIRDIATQARGKSSDEIAELISTVDAIDATEDFYELTHDAVNARAETLKSLGEAYNDRLSFEETQRQLAEQEAQRKAMEAEQAVERRINNLKMIPLEYMQRSYADTKGQLDRLVNFVPEEKDFAGRLDEVKLAMSNVISQLTAMADQKLVMEEMAAKQSAVQVEKDEPENFRKDPEPEIKAPALAVFDEKPAKEPEVVKLVTMLVTCSSADVNRIMKMVHTVAGAEISLLNN